MKDQRKRQKQSEIFAQEEQQKAKQSAPSKTEKPQSKLQAKRIDLTQTQMQKEEKKDEDEEVDEFDLLDAKVNPRDIKTQAKIIKLEDDIEYEKTLIKCKLAFKYSFAPGDPLKIAE